MDPSIRRVQPEAALLHGAVRPVGPRRERSAKDGTEFSDELEKRAGERGARGGADTTFAGERRPYDHDHEPGQGSEVGSRLDVFA
jgi:hypothetical protein